jgi:predicted amidohydrolase
MGLKIATCQFAVSESIARNAQQICAQMQKAKKAGAEIAHFPECALSGYIGFDFPNFDGFDWELLEKETAKITTLAGKLNMTSVFARKGSYAGLRPAIALLFLQSTALNAHS